MPQLSALNPNQKGAIVFGDTPSLEKAAIQAF
jgi:hypothetical protein